MPTLPSWASAWLLARESGEAALALLTLTHSEWGAPYRLARNPVAVVSQSLTYSAAWFDVDVINDDGEPPRATLTIPNVDRAIGQMVMGLSSPPEVAIEVVGSDHLDEPIYRAARLELRAIKIDKMAISGTLVTRDFSAETLGTIHVTPGRFPALFRVRR